ncbi:MAG: DNA repair protein RadC [Firmicutes bacterium]|nr:DNA repair protein RadC [Bacillota bacterium]
MKIKEMPAGERPVEKLFSHGKATLSNSELIGILLGSGTREASAVGLADEIISAAGGLRGLSELDCEDLIRIRGIGPRKAATIVCALELGRRVATETGKQRMCVRSPRSLAELFMEDMRYAHKEYFKVLMLNVKLEIIGMETVSVGELSGAPVHPRESFEPAIRKGAAAVCFAHNHPSGDPTPSDDDLKITRRLMECGDLLGIRVLDHIIIGDGVYSSLKEEGYI